MRILFITCCAALLSGCVVVSAVDTAASVTVDAVGATVDAAGDAIGYVLD